MEQQSDTRNDHGQKVHTIQRSQKQQNISQKKLYANIP